MRTVCLPIFIASLLFSTSLSAASDYEQKIETLVNNLAAVYEKEGLTPPRAKDLRLELDFYGVEAVPIFERFFLESRDPLKRIIGLEWLSGHLDEGSIDYIYKGMKDKHADVRLTAVKLIKHIKDSRALNRLIEALLNEEDSYVSVMTMMAIRRFRDVKATAVLRSHLDHDNAAIREAARRLLFTNPTKQTWVEMTLEEKISSVRQVITAYSKRGVLIRKSSGFYLKAVDRMNLEPEAFSTIRLTELIQNIAVDNQDYSQSAL